MQVQPVLPDVLHASIYWQSWVIRTYVVGQSAGCSGEVWRPFGPWDPSYNYGDSEFSGKDIISLAKMGYRKYFVKRCSMKIRMHTTATGGHKLDHYLTVLPLKPGDAIPHYLAYKRDLDWNNAMPIMTHRFKSTTQGGVNGHASVTPGYYYPHQRAVQDPGNWGDMAWNGSAATYTNPSNNWRMWIGMFSDQVMTADISYNARIAFKFDCIFIRGPATYNPKSLDKWVPYDTWDELEGLGESPDQTGTPEHFEAQDDTALTGDGDDLANQVQWNPTTP